MNKRFLIPILFLILFSVFGYSIKSPDEFLGTHVGADRTLVKYPDIVKYFNYLDSESERVKVTDEGKTTLGNPMILAFISSEENIRQLPALIEINKKLANPDTISTEEAITLKKQAKAFILITCSIHATEIAASQMSLLLAHKLASDKNGELTKFLDDVVLLLMPSINPDGNIMVTDWYNKYLGTEYEGGPMPYLYHYYAGHDNNRDFYMLNLKETRVVNAILHQRYFPLVFLDMHQMGSTGPRIFVPPFHNPVNENLEPLMLRETDIIGYYMALKLQENEKKGVVSSYSFDAYWPGGSKNTAWYKNVVGILTEMASVKVATPIYVESNELDAGGKGLPEYKAQTNFPDPWPGGWWRLHDIIDYELIAAEALIEMASKNKDSFVSNFYKLGTTSIEKGKNEPPYGYIIPLDQWDVPTMYEFLSRMEKSGVRIFKLDADYMAGNTLYKKDSLYIPMDQPYRNFIKTMMERQEYPLLKQMANGPLIEPYDAVGWTLPLQMGVKTFTLDTPPVNITASKFVSIGLPFETVTGTDQGNENYFCFPGRFNRTAMVVNRLFKNNISVFRYTGEDKKDILKGDFLVKKADLNADLLQKTLPGSGVSPHLVSITPSNEIKPISKPRIAIYQPYRLTADEGWTRWVLDEFEFPFTLLHNKDFTDKKIDFSKLYDVILFANQDRDTIVNGKRTDGRLNFDAGIPPEFRGGISADGVKNLIEFTKKGGTIILLNQASELGSKDFELPFTNILKERKDNSFYCPGSILRIKIDTSDPIGWGLEKENIIFFAGETAFKTRESATNSISRKVTAEFGASGHHLLSGYLKGENILDRMAIIMHFDYYKGHVIVLGGAVQNRAQTFATFKLLFNALYYQVKTRN